MLWTEFGERFASHLRALLEDPEMRAFLAAAPRRSTPGNRRRPPPPRAVLPPSDPDRRLRDYNWIGTLFER